MKKNKEIDYIDSLLPQIHCQKCGYNDCRSYAKAVVKNKATIDLCLPGGQITILSLSNYLNKPIKNLDFSQKIQKKSHQIAFIDENNCIGCTICINKCPVDAIVGAKKRVHTIVNQECTGCELCVIPCPVDCISMIDVDYCRTKIDIENSKKRREKQKKRLSERKKNIKNQEIGNKKENEEEKKNLLKEIIFQGSIRSKKEL